MTEQESKQTASQKYQIDYESGLAFAQKNQWQDAIAKYQEAVACKPDVAEIYHHWGDALINLHKWSEAADRYQKAIELDPNFAWSYHNLGRAWFNLNKLEEAIVQYKIAVNLNRENSQFHLSLGKAEAKLGEWQAAASSYQSAISLGLKQADIYHQLGDICSELKLWNDSISAYQGAIELDQNSIWSYHNLGLALLELELAQEAIAFFKRAVALDQNLVSAYYFMGVAWRSQKKWGQAIATLRKTIKKDPNFRDATLLLADSLQQRSQSDLDSAISTYLQLLAKPNPEILPAVINWKIAEILRQQQKLDQALFYLQHAIDLAPHNLDYLTAYQEICRHRGKLYEPLASRKIADCSYDLWNRKQQKTPEDFRTFCSALGKLEVRPTIAIILPLTQAGEWVAEAINTIQNQVYPHWRLYIATATNGDEEEAYWQEDSLSWLVQSYIDNDYRIQHLTGDLGMTAADLSNLAQDQITEEWALILAPQTFLTPTALGEFARYLQNQETANLELIYGDEDNVNKNNLLSEPWFKPQWCPDLLRSRDYFGAVVFVKSYLLKQHPFTNDCGDAYRYDFYLKISEQTEKIGRIPHILAHRQPIAISEEETTKAVTAALARSGESGIINSNLDFPEIKTIHYELERQSLVSIIIPTRNLGEILNDCLNSIFELTTYTNYEVLVVDNGSDEPATKEILQSWQEREPDRLKTLRLDIPFNYSQLNNQAVAVAQGKYLLFLNNDTKVITPQWLEAMVGQAQRQSIGAVGVMLLYPDETIQHAGVILGVSGTAGHGHRNYPASAVGYKQALLSTTNYSAVTAACLMCRREIFEEVEGFNESLAVAYNDVDFCLQLTQKGYYNVCLTQVRLYHYESQTRTPEDTPEKQQRIQQEIAYLEQTWGTIIKSDPCYNPNLTREKEDYGLNLQHKAEVRAIFLAEVSPETLHGFFFDEPKPGNISQKTLEVVGWVLGNQVGVKKVEIRHGEEVMAMADLIEARPDVALVYPQINQAVNCGFSTTVDLTLLPPRAALTIHAILDNNSPIRLGKIQL